MCTSCSILLDGWMDGWMGAIRVGGGGGGKRKTTTNSRNEANPFFLLSLSTTLRFIPCVSWRAVDRPCDVRVAQLPGNGVLSPAAADDKRGDAVGVEAAVAGGWERK